MDSIDTTGAGDSFSSGLIYAYHHRLDLLTAGTLASALGALATTVYGGGLGMNWRTKLVSFLLERSELPELGPYVEGIAKLLMHIRRLDTRGNCEN